MPANKYHPSWKIAVAVVVPMLLTLGFLGHLIAPTTNASILNAVFVIASCSLGWAIGMILAPDDLEEAKKFDGLWKGLSLFASGYLASKFGSLLDEFLKPEVIKGIHDDVIIYRLLACPAALLLTAILTYVVRVYAFNAGGDYGVEDKPENVNATPPPTVEVPKTPTPP